MIPLLAAAFATLFLGDAPQAALDGAYHLNGYWCEAWQRGVDASQPPVALACEVTYSEQSGPWADVQFAYPIPPVGVVVYGCIGASLQDAQGNTIQSECVTQESCVPLPPADYLAPTNVRQAGFQCSAPQF